MSECKHEFWLEVSHGKIVCSHCEIRLSNYLKHLRARLEAAEAKVSKYESRLGISPYGDDKIDELEEALSFIEFDRDNWRRQNNELSKEIGQLETTIAQMRGALEKIIEYDPRWAGLLARETLQNPTEYEKRVQSLVDGLESISQSGYSPDALIAKSALAAFRGGEK